jgi:hypothetical protein
LVVLVRADIHWPARRFQQGRLGEEDTIRISQCHSWETDKPGRAAWLTIAVPVRWRTSKTMHRASSPLHNDQRARVPTSSLKIDWSHGGKNSKSSGLKVCVEHILKSTVKPHTKHAPNVEAYLPTPTATPIASESVRTASTCAPAARIQSHSGLSSRKPCRYVPAPHGVSPAGFKLWPTT